MNWMEVAIIAVVFAVAGIGWYRARANAHLETELSLSMFVMHLLYDDEERKRHADDLFSYVGSLPRYSGDGGRIVSSASIHLIRIANDKFKDPEYRKDALALLISMQG